MSRPERGQATARPSGPRVGLLHTVPALAGTFHDLLAAEAPDVAVVHVADPGLLASAIAEGVTDEVCRRVVGHARHLAEVGATVVMVTCSSIGEAAEAARSTSVVPVLRVDAAMATQAVALATAPAARGAIAVLATLASTLGPTGRLIERNVTRAGARVEVVTAVVTGAADARASGNQAAHDAAVADAVALAADGADVVVLAQASMAPAAQAADAPVPVLSSPASGVANLLQVAAGRR